ncbi:MAG: hypothetical protein WCN98_11855 [Verrucomicrobiaceae bacterium]
MRIIFVIRELGKLHHILGTVSEKSEINIAVDEMMTEVLRFGLGELSEVVKAGTAVEVASMYYGVLSTCNPELCCAFMERLKHEQHAAWTAVLENFSTETLNTLA